MKATEARYLENFDSIKGSAIPPSSKVIANLLVSIIIFVVLILWFVPWIQTAYGPGIVDSVSPQNRAQVISALISGKIEQWHVREGQRVKKGDPIVTLVDIDKEVVSRLTARLKAVEARHKANLSAIDSALSNVTRQRALMAEGLVSERDIEQLEISLEGLRASAAATEAEMNEAKVALARISTRTKVAPMDGVILKLFAAGNATLINAGDELAQFIPDGDDRAAVIKVSGLDAPLVHVGRKVRLQFEGWPVFQFSGWPSVAVGTFGGVVQFVEPVADAQGRFNVWIKEDTSDIPWPTIEYVRFGTRVKGWILLEEVKLGYELWRQMNNFPPERTSTEAQ
ncbi:MAG: HlyD family efflux transporter periplasmic adaptor subunit [Kangiellaceae bacterium]|jgi:multidrug efflux pump subunit AcrA (membrane-fusion protein)|nr:HlyD family efflux transporter periplasmic adaptor subunit [Kangiellaceae bacterium]